MSEDERLVITREWVRYAEVDLQGAKREERAGALGHACFFAQQCAEKALKAILVFEDIDPPKVHDLDAIMTMIPDGWALQCAPAELATLSDWAVASRYPFVVEEATHETTRHAIEIAESIFVNVRAQLVGRDDRLRG
jgi:HEPN domain-containing protein